MIQEIKDFINQNIKENGKGGITGTILNSVLNKIADWMQTAEKKVSAKKTLSGIFRLRSYEECGFYGAKQDVLYFPWLKDKIKEEEDSNHFLEIDWAITSRADLMNLEKYGEVGYSEGSYTLKTKAFIYKKDNYINASVNNMILGIDGQSKGSLIPDIGIYLQYCSRYYNKDNKEEYQQSPHGDTILWLSMEVNGGTNGFEFDDRESWGNLSYGPAYIECRIDRVLFDGEEIPLELCVLAKDAPNYYGNYYYGDITKPYPFYVNYSYAELLRPIDDLIKERSYGSYSGKLITINQNGAVTRWQNTHLDFLCSRELDLNLPTLKSKTLSISGSRSVINIEQTAPRSSVCRQTTADGNVVMASIFLKDDSSLGDNDDYDKCVLVFGYAGQDNDGHIKEFGELTIDLRNGFDLTYSGSNKSELKVKKDDGIAYQRTISIMSNCKANEFRALYLKSSVQIDAKQTEPLLTFNVPASKGYITAVVADSSVQGQSTYINQVASVAEQIADKLPYANPFYYSDYSTDYYDAETQTLTLLEGKTMAHIYPTEPLMVKHIVLPEVKTGQRLAIYGNWIPVVEDGDEQEGRFSAAWRTDVANGFEDLIYLNGQWINKA